MTLDASAERAVRSGAPSQTLSRALTLLERVAEAPTPPTIAELAESLDVHRSVAYRMLRTFEAHGLLRRDDAGRVHPAPGLAVLAGRVEEDLRSAAVVELSAIAAELGMSAFLVVGDGADCLTLETVDPPRGTVVTQRPGTRHPLGVGAPGIAIAAALPEGRGPAARPEVDEARERGWAASADEVISGVTSVAAPLVAPGQRPAALAVVFPTRPADTEAIAARLTAGAAAVAEALGRG